MPISSRSTPPSSTSWLSRLALAIGVLLMLPIASMGLIAIAQDNGTVAHLMRTVMGEYLINTIVLAAGVAIGVFLLGTGTAWLVAMCQFPGRAFFEWALIVPLAIPAYILAYAYTDLLAHHGMVQSGLRDLMGWGPRDYWFPDVRSRGGAIAMFVLVLYPYVYLLARTAFIEQSTCYIEVARTMGRSPWQTFRQISLPLARPAIAAGVALALMETLADFGTVAHFGVPTFTTGIYRAWRSMDDPVAAAQLATVLLTLVFSIVIAERLARGDTRFTGGRRVQALPAYQLTGWASAAAIAACALPVVFGFILPVFVLVELGWNNNATILSDRYIRLASNSVTLATTTATAAIVIALVLAYAARLAPGWRSALANRLTNLGYAVPGSIIAIAVLIPFAAFDNALDGFLRSNLGMSSGLLLTGSIAALVFAYLVRFMAVALDGVEASLARIAPSIDAASRTLGETQFGTLRRVHLPMLRGGLLTAALMVFVDVMKELPATLIMSPFNYETLAVQAYRLASDERLQQAATPSLALICVGLLPVIILSRRIMASRSSQRTGTPRRTIPAPLPAE